MRRHIRRRHADFNVWAIALLAGTQLLAGCVSHSSRKTEDAQNEDALTLEDGSAYVVEGSPTRVILLKSVKNKPLPVNADEMPGKVIVIHPLPDAAEDGVVSRVVSVEEEDDTYVIEAKPITIDEIQKLREDDILRIYMDRTITKKTASDLSAQSLFDSTLSTQKWSGAFVGEPTVVTWAGLSPKVDFLGFITPHLKTFSVEPDGLFQFDKGGLDLGARMHMATEASLSVRGIVGGSEKVGSVKFFEMKKDFTKVLQFFFVGPIPIPYYVGLSGGIRCNAVGSSRVDLQACKLEYSIVSPK